MTVRSNFNTDTKGDPHGGTSFAPGFVIQWKQSEHHDGATFEDVIGAAVQRLEFLQRSRFACPENAEMLQHLNAALAAQEARQQRRMAEGTLGSKNP